MQCLVYLRQSAIVGLPDRFVFTLSTLANGRHIDVLLAFAEPACLQFAIAERRRCAGLRELLRLARERADPSLQFTSAPCQLVRLTQEVHSYGFEPCLRLIGDGNELWRDRRELAVGVPGR